MTDALAKGLITGFATEEGTRRFADRIISKSGGKVRPDFYKKVEGLTLSTLGLGTYLGEPDSQDDNNLSAALEQAIKNGINVIDSAINYRAQRSERIIGQVLTRLIKDGVIQRDEIFISTKGGFIPFDDNYPTDPQKYFSDKFLKTKILTEADVVSGCHSLAPSFIENQFDQSRKNLNLETIDLYYLHNPETQLEEITRDSFVHRLHRAFQVLESRVAQGSLNHYGTATWNGYRVGVTSKELLNLEEIIDTAADHGDGHSFKFIQLPLNLAMPEGLSEKNQQGLPILQKAAALGIHVMTSASIMQGRILGQMKSNLDVLAPGQTDAVKALNFVRSAPGVDVALCGMKQSRHVSENLKLATVPPVSAATLAQLASV